MRSHRRTELRSLALHGAVAEHLRGDPALLEKARRRVAGWRDAQTVDAFYVDAWASLLDHSVEAVCEVLTEDSERAHTLRQVSPFAGALSPKERWAILRELESS